MSRPATRAALAALLVSIGIGGNARAARFALLIGNNQGHGDDAELRFAQSDTERFGEILSRMGGFGTGSVVVTLGSTASEIRRALVQLKDRLQSTPGEHLVLVYYSGHADAQSLHLGSSSLSLEELKESVTAIPVATRVLIIDACQAGVFTRPKGGRPGAGFEIRLGTAEETRGLAILASSSASELAQESDQLGGSVFTHFLLTGLAGLADRNRDGSVSLTEAFEYTSERTLTATFRTTTGPQHPTFRVDLTGRDDLVLTRPGLPGVGYGQLRIDVPGWYFIRRRDGTIAAEVVSRGNEAMGLEPGPYEITRRESHSLDVAWVNVTEGGTAVLSEAPTHPIAFGRMVRKGGSESVAYALAVATTVRTPLEDLGAAIGGAVAARVDLSAVSLELRGSADRAHQASAHLTSTTWDLSAAVAALRVHDGVTSAPGSRRSSGWLSRLTWAFGVEAGVSYMVQLLDDGARQSSLSPFAGPVALAELPTSRRFFLRADLGLPVYALRTQASGAAETVFRPALATNLGGGIWF
jgi:hypothetical protein